MPETAEARDTPTDDVTCAMCAAMVSDCSSVLCSDAASSSPTASPLELPVALNSARSDPNMTADVRLGRLASGSPSIGGGELSEGAGRGTKEMKFGGLVHANEGNKGCK